MTTEQKVKAYDEAIKRAKAVIKVAQNQKEVYDCIITIFPELKEPEEEKIRKDLIGWFEDFPDMIWRGHNCRGHYTKDIIKWLENQDKESSWKPSKEQISALEHFVRSIGESGYASPYDSNTNLINSLINDLYKIQKEDEQKPADKSEPKFKVGDWITNGQLTCKVLSIIGKSYELHLYNDDYCHFETDVQSIDKYYHLWSIQDAKPGDVLTLSYASKNHIIIYKGLYEKNFKTIMSVFCSYCVEEDTYYDGTDSFHVMNRGEIITPTTKEQRDTLMKAMADAGYGFDFLKKELKKIRQKHTQEIEPFEVEHGKYYYCIKDYYSGGRKQASKGDVVQALRGLPIIGLKDASEYFLPVNFIKCNSAWSKEDERIYQSIIDDTVQENQLDIKQIDWIKSIKERYAWKPSDDQINAIRLARSFVVDDFGEHPTLSEILMELEEQLQKIKENKL